MAALKTALLKPFRQLETLAAATFKTRNAAEEALRATKRDISLTGVVGRNAGRDGAHAETANKLMESVLSRATAKAVSGATDNTAVFHVAVGAAEDAAAATPSLRAVLNDLRRGHVTRVLDELGAPADSAFRHADFVKRLTRTLRETFPDDVVENALRRSRDAPGIPADLFEITAYGDTARELAATIGRHADAERLVKAMEKSLRSGRPIVSRGLFFSVVLTSGGAAAVYAALAEGAKRAAGCWRVYRDRDTGEVVSCRVRYACCDIGGGGGGDGGGLPEHKYCSHYPAVVRETSCRDEWSGKTPCVRCDPAGTGTDRLDAQDFVDAGDVYVCLAKPSLGEMLGQVVLDAPHVLGEAANDVVQGAEGVLGRLLNEALRVGMWILVGLAMTVAVLYFWERRTEKNREIRDDGDDNDARHSEDDEYRDRVDDKSVLLPRRRRHKNWGK